MVPTETNKSEFEQATPTNTSFDTRLASLVSGETNKLLDEAEWDFFRLIQQAERELERV